MKNFESIVRANLGKILEHDPAQSAAIDLDSSLFDDLGLTSLDMIVMMTAICRDAGTPLTQFTPDDMQRIDRPAVIIELLEQKALAGAV